jgi:hypothetical protein
MLELDSHLCPNVRTLQNVQTFTNWLLLGDYQRVLGR